VLTAAKGCFGQACSRILLQIVCAVLFLTAAGWGQTASTGALIGDVLDPSGKGTPHASVEVKSKDGTLNRSILSDDEGHFVLPLLPPGAYKVTIAKGGFSPQSTSVLISVSETIRLSVPMKVAGTTQSIEVHAYVSQLQADSVALGGVIDAHTVQTLPLATRNFTQIVDLSAGVSTGVNNAGELGPGGSGLAQIDAGNDGI
jgi:hypothetical protein